MAADGSSLSPDLGTALSLRVPVPRPHSLPYPVSRQSGEGQDKGLAPLSQSGTTLKGHPSPELLLGTTEGSGAILLSPSFSLFPVLYPSPLTGVILENTP